MNKFKKLMEKRAQDIAQMELLTTTAETEERAMTEEEAKQFAELEAEVRAIDATIEAANRARDLDQVEDPAEEEQRAEEIPVEEVEERAFANYIRGVVEERGDVNMTTGANGAVIPASIANKIIEMVKDICPIYAMAEHYNVKGTLSIPYYDEATQKITVAYASEFTDLESTSGKFLSVTLQSYLAGALTKVSKSLINNNQFDIVSFVVRRMAEAISAFLEKELLVGNSSGGVEALYGVGAGMTKTAAAASAITADELIDLQEMIPDAYQRDCVWIMNKTTRTAIRKLKDGQGNYLLEKDSTARWKYRLMGADVYVSDSMPAIGANNKAIYYGDFSGLALKLSEEMEIEVLRERYAAQHAVGVVAWIEFDAKIQNAQKIAALKCAASDPQGATGDTGES